MVAILDFSVSARIQSSYPPDMQYRGPNDVESIGEKL